MTKAESAPPAPDSFPRRRWSWLLAVLVGMAALGVLLSGLFVPSVYSWWGYEEGHWMFEASPDTPTVVGGTRLTSVAIFRRDVRKKRFEFFPGPEYLLDGSFCGSCNQGEHGNCSEMFRIYAEDESFSLELRCRCRAAGH